ncbi:MAG: hypothetical protein LBJ11_04395 [Oscillospiraceae bacterium]|jgi:sedoheptulokinase|nr:hypothetical protein [Oscillospiraceae bacterium]
MPWLGLDIGTSSICAVVTADDGKKILTGRTIANDTGLRSIRTFEAIQNPQRIWLICETLVRGCLGSVPDIRGIGVTGQMHGLLYLNDRGDAVSPLFTWQDESGSEPAGDGQTYAQCLSELSGYAMASGFGGTTLFVHARQSMIPEDAAWICTIHDYIAMRLCGLPHPVMHSSDAASFGLYDLAKGDFDRTAIDKAGLPQALFPTVTGEFDELGKWQGISVRVAVGDNQASFLGAAESLEESVLVNVGTGSQLSFCTEYLPPEKVAPGAELRPLRGDRFLYVGSALCGGRAYALLEQFFRHCAALAAVAAGGNQPEDQRLYAAMDEMLREGPPPAEEIPLVDPRFAGTRRDPAMRGAIAGLGLHNFTPRHLMWGMMFGMAEELYGFYADAGVTRTELVGAGNGLRQNLALRRVVAARFGMPMMIPDFQEEAARGAAKLCGM